ncbi:vitamin B12 dependent-methionine synthase activation domain-containing protein [Chloroflexota bacterium]
MLNLTNQIDVEKQQVLSRIGYANEYQPSARIMSLVDDYVENYHDLLVPAYSYTIKDVVSVKGSIVTIEDSIQFKSKVIARLLEPCEKVAVFALTIGNHLEEMVSYLAENGFMLQATVLDAVGSGAAEQMAVSMEDRIRKLASLEGLSASRRFSPGYCDWAVSQQKMVFQALGGDSAGIVLTESSLMIPQKSVSGIIGLAKGNIEDYNPCHTCKKRECPGRR